ncbi:hypothetical protein [Paracoccus sp. T5]|uniref:hypothetical protein n=1 Tax=Paracoccus sp. T5 TaxID=3402161 RepID=UPI003AEEF7A3
MRIIGLDAARSLAIVLAMSSHVYVEAGLQPHVPDQLSQIMRLAFQIATPTFILLFGTMLEVIYQPRWTSTAARRQVAGHLVSRALQCWALYAISIFALFLSHDQYSLRFSIGTMLFMGNSPYTEILKFYAVVLALASVLLWLRARLGLWPLVVAALAYHAAWPLLTALPDAHHDLGAPLAVGRLIMFATGFGGLQLAGPSILHGLTLVVAGQCLGQHPSLPGRLLAQGAGGLAGMGDPAAAGDLRDELGLRPGGAPVAGGRDGPRPSETAHRPHGTGPPEPDLAPPARRLSAISPSWRRWAASGSGPAAGLRAR